MAANLKLRFVLTACLLGTTLLHILVFWLAWSDVVAGRPDFSIFYTAGLMLRRGQGPELYDNRLQWQTQREFTSAMPARQGPLPYNHPPFEAVLCVPLTYLSYFHAYVVWAMLNLLLLAGIVLILRPDLPRLCGTLPWLPLLAAVGFYPIAVALMQGQDSILLLALYTLAYAALRRGHDAEAGVWLGLGLFKFHLVLPFVFVLLLRRRWRALTGFLVSGIAVGLISLGLVGWRELLYYPRYVWEVNRHPPIDVIVPANMANLRGLILGWSWGPLVLPWLNAAVFAASVGMLCWAAAQWDPAGRDNETTWINGFSISMIATILVSYHGYNQDMSILFLPALLWFEQLLAGRVEGRYRLALEFCLGALFLSPLHVILTLHYGHQNLFALVLLATAATLAGWTATVQRSGGRSVAITPASL